MMFVPLGFQPPKKKLFSLNLSRITEQIGTINKNLRALYFDWNY